MMQQAISITSVDPEEVERFSRIADEWWDETGKFAPLHRINPVRIGYILDQAAARFGLDRQQREPLAGLSLADIGCGGGLISEPMARLGAKVTGIDASEKNIAVSSLHAERSGLAIDYRKATAEEMAAEKASFDIVLALEVIEHVADVSGFLRDVSALVKPGGLLVLSTLNRTAKAWAMAIIGAEYVLRWLPKGTHQWSKFLRPSEIEPHLREHGLALHHLTGMVYHPLSGSWSLNEQDLDVNYLLTAVRD